ncbi:hypothetical protein P3T22_004724 [Paraburkholderia sp. GAS348]
MCRFARLGVPASGSRAPPPPRLLVSRGHSALIPDASGPCRPARSACQWKAAKGRAVLLFPSPYHGVLTVKGGGPMAFAAAAVCKH